MNRRRIYLLGALLMILVIALAACDDDDDPVVEPTLTPVPEATILARDPAATVSGDENAPALDAVRAFLEGRNYDVLADDIVFEDPSAALVAEGDPELATQQGLFFGEAFTNQRTDPLHYYVTGDAVVAEFVYVGDHSGDYFGTPGTGSQVVVPMAGFFRVDGDRISEMRLYYDLQTVNTAIGFGPGLGAAAAPAVPPGPPMASVAVTDISEDFDNFIGQTVVVTGAVDRVINESAFTLRDEDAVDLDGQQFILVIAGTGEGFTFPYTEGESVTVTGTIRTFEMDGLEEELGYTFDRETLAEYQDMPVIIADTRF